jgi:hypothetical protein
MDFAFTADETTVVETAAALAAASDPWAALVAGGWIDLLTGSDVGAGTEPAEEFGFLGLVVEELGAAGVTVPLIGTAGVWPALFDGSAGGRVAVAGFPSLPHPGTPRAALDGAPGQGADSGALLAEDGITADRVVSFGGEDSGASAHTVLARMPAGADGDSLAWVTPDPAALAVTDDPVRIAEAQRRAAALAAAEMAGALRRVTALTVAYVRSREQFGRPVSAFQSVAHGAAHLATLSEGATWVARLACRSTDPADAHAAKGWVSQAAQEASALAHQLHGAIGFTEEYALQRLTKRLRALRFAWGDDRYHHAALGTRRRSSAG